MKRPIMWRAATLAAMFATPLLLPSCAPDTHTATRGENVSFYFNSEFTCPDRLPAWRMLHEPASAAGSTPYQSHGSFEKALSEMGQRSR